MAEHTCMHEVDIALMAANVAEIKKLLKGNGKKGLVEEFQDFKLKTIVAIIIISLGGVGSGVGFFKLLQGLIL